MTKDRMSGRMIEAAGNVPPKRARLIALAAAAAAGFTLAAAAQSQQTPVPRAGHETMAPVTQHHEMRALMRELSQAIDRMGAQMADVPASQPQMAARMKELAGLLDTMSGMLARPAHTAEDKAQVAQFRQRLRALAAADAASAAAQPAGGVEERMAQLDADLDALDAQMERVRAAADPAERSRLLGEHARALRRAMAQVRELDRAFSPQMRAMMGGGRQGISAERMMLAHDLMARRIALMERLTQQVMEQSMGHGEGTARK